MSPRSLLSRHVRRRGLTFANSRHKRCCFRLSQHQHPRSRPASFLPLAYSPPSIAQRRPCAPCSAVLHIDHVDCHTTGLQLFQMMRDRWVYSTGLACGDGGSTCRTCHISSCRQEGLCGAKRPAFQAPAVAAIPHAIVPICHLIQWPLPGGHVPRQWGRGRVGCKP